MFLEANADIAIYGGSAFAGKTFALLLEMLRWIQDPDFAAVVFRRDTTQIRNPGGLWDESTKLYRLFGCRSLSNSLEQWFPSGAVVKFAHLQYADDVYSWDGAQIPVIGFDQLESFLHSQFFYMLSRNRDPSGKIRPYIRATCNPDPDSWLGEFLEWWIDQRKELEDGTLNPGYGFARWDRAGVVRWFVRVDETVFWGDSREELMERFGEDSYPMSVTFVPGRIWDNKIGMKNDPGYLAKLKAMQRVERERLLGDKELGGNWKVRAAAGLMFRRDWCETVEAEPEGVDWIRAWDFAATKKTDGNDPDWTVGVKLGRYRGRKRYVIAPNVTRDRVAPAGVERMLLNTAQADGKPVRIRIPQDPGQAGKDQARRFVGLLAGFSVKFRPVTGDKVTRFSPFSAQAEAGNVDLVRGIPDEYLRQLENFPDGAHDDDADATSDAFNGFNEGGAGNMIEFYREQAADQARAALQNAAAPKGSVTVRSDIDLQGTVRTDPVAEHAAHVAELQKRGHRPQAPVKTVAQLAAEAPTKQVIRTSSFEEAMRAQQS